MDLKLTEGNGIAALAEPMADFSRRAGFGNATNTVGPARSLLVSNDEQAWISDIVAIARPMNLSVAVINAEEEAQILSLPDVAVAVGAAIPDLEAWEQTL
jgi:hypothetical protein